MYCANVSVHSRATRDKDVCCVRPVEGNAVAIIPMHGTYKCDCSYNRLIVIVNAHKTAFGQLI